VQLHLQGISLDFAFEGNRATVKVTAAKKHEILLSTT